MDEQDEQVVALPMKKLQVLLDYELEQVLEQTGAEEVVLQLARIFPCNIADCDVEHFGLLGNLFGYFRSLRARAKLEGIDAKKDLDDARERTSLIFDALKILAKQPKDGMGVITMRFGDDARTVNVADLAAANLPEAYTLEFPKFEKAPDVETGKAMAHAHPAYLYLKNREMDIESRIAEAAKREIAADAVMSYLAMYMTALKTWQTGRLIGMANTGVGTTGAGMLAQAIQHKDTSWGDD